MSHRWGFGPVFAVESLLNARRLTIYAGRSLFGGVLLAGLVFTWLSTALDRTAGTAPGSLKHLAHVGEAFYHTLTTLQLSLVLLAAPAATAGAICLDRARGGLTHLLVTDLSDAEIVLGKLAARLAPVVGLLACTLPVTAMATLLGGIDAAALNWSFIICVAVAVLGCSLAMTISVWATRSHDVIMTVVVIWTAGLLALPVWEEFPTGWGITPPPDWFQKLNPFILISAPYSQPGFVGAVDYLVFVVAALAASAILNGVTIASLRRSMAGEADRSRRWSRRGLRGVLPGPPLDSNPVLWLDWHRNRPSRLGRIVWTTFAVVSVLGTIWGVVDASTGASASSALTIVATSQVFVGLLLASASAPAALCEERVRGSLDVVLATPLSTRAIVLGKWLGAFRIVPWLALLPVIAAVAIAVCAPSPVTPPPGAMWPARVITVADRIMIPMLMAGHVLACGAAITSLGLALAILTPRAGRAIGLSVAAYIFLAIGWPMLGSLVAGRFSIGQTWAIGVAFVVFGLSPVGGTVMIMQWLFLFWQLSAPAWLLWLTEGLCILAISAFAAALLWFSIRTFDRRLGRAPERPREAAPKV
jgi:hypothetical protein